MKKLKKLLRDPERFLFDLLRKRIENRSFSITSETACHYSEAGVSVTNFTRSKLLGIFSSAFGGVDGLSDGKDRNSLLINAERFEFLCKVIDDVCEEQLVDLKFYTLDGIHRYKLSHQIQPGLRRLLKTLSEVQDFVMELSFPDGPVYVVIHFYLGDTSPLGEVVVRSNQAWLRKFDVNGFKLTQSVHRAERVEPTIDVVYTWVNSGDLDWQRRWEAEFPEGTHDSDRYSSHDELRYSLRSVEKYAPWINRIYVVSNCAAPEWLQITHPKIKWVDHQEIFPDLSVLPTFNSHAIEACLHHVPDLSEKFIYFNDDFFLGQPCLPSDFFDDHGRSISYLEDSGILFSEDGAGVTPDYIVATCNSSRLLSQLFNYTPRRLHKHVPYALTKSVLEALERKFCSEFRITAKAKVRSDTDLNIVSFLYGHYANAIGVGVAKSVNNFSAKPSNINKLLDLGSVKYKFICVNDGGGSSKDRIYREMTQRFFLERYSEPAPWENGSSVDGQYSSRN
jgi:hypothetical protein